MEEKNNMIEEAVVSLMEVYGKRRDAVGDKILVTLWQKALNQLSENEIGVGFRGLIKTRVKSGMPSPAEFYEALYSDLSDDALMAWNQLFQVLKSHPGRPISFGDTVLAEAVRRLGGLNFLGELSGTDLQWQRKSFIETYCILAKKEELFERVCQGTYDAKPIEIPSMSHRKVLVSGEAL